MTHPKYNKIGYVEDRVIEECAELTHILCKIKRFGPKNYHPDDKAKTPNWYLALNEISDLESVLAELKGKLILHLEARDAQD